MGNFYTNFALRGATQQSVASALAGRSAIVTAPVNDVVVVFDEQSDSQDTEVISSLAADLSSKCGCAVLATMNHDDDVLWYELFTGGKRVDEYNSCPGYFDDSIEGDEPAGGDAATLVAAFGAKNPDLVEKALRAPGEDFTFAIERHTAIAEALGLPSFVVGGGFTYINDGELPDGLAKDTLIRTD